MNSSFDELVAALGEVPELKSRKGEIEALVITEGLYSRIMKFISTKRLITTTFNHGKGVDRTYTVKFCLQRNYDDGGVTKKCLLKCSGRSPPRYPGFGPPCESYEDLTPSFEKMCLDIKKKYPRDILATYRFK